MPPLGPKRGLAEGWPAPAAPVPVSPETTGLVAPEVLACSALVWDCALDGRIPTAAAHLSSALRARDPTGPREAARRLRTDLRTEPEGRDDPRTRLAVRLRVAPEAPTAADRNRPNLVLNDAEGDSDPDSDLGVRLRIWDPAPSAPASALPARLASEPAADAVPATRT